MHLGVTVNALTVMLLISAVVAIVARRLALPYTVGLVAVGALVGALHRPMHLHLTEDLLFTLLLPPLIFEAALQTEWSALRRELGVVMLLATLGVLVSAAIITGGICALAHWPLSAALVTAVLLSATDPVSVIAAFKDSGIGGRLRIIVEAESLFNDGTVAVLFTVALALTTATGDSPPHAIFLNALLSFVTTFFGGLLCGLLVGGIALLLAGRTKDYLAEITFTAVAAYGSSLLAAHYHLSSVLAVMAAGILMGNVGPGRAFSERGRRIVVVVWEFIAFVVNSIIFLLIGSALVRLRFTSVLIDSVIVVALTLIARAVTVYGLCLPFCRSKFSVPAGHQLILFWGGLRGALALALVLATPTTFPMRDQMVAVVFFVVGFSVVVQGLTVTTLLRRIGKGETSTADNAKPQRSRKQEAA